MKHPILASLLLLAGAGCGGSNATGGSGTPDGGGSQPVAPATVCSGGWQFATVPDASDAPAIAAATDDAVWHVFYYASDGRTLRYDASDRVDGPETVAIPAISLSAYPIVVVSADGDTASGIALDDASQAIVQVTRGAQGWSESPLLTATQAHGVNDLGAGFDGQGALHVLTGGAAMGVADWTTGSGAATSLAVSDTYQARLETTLRDRDGHLHAFWEGSSDVKGQAVQVIQHGSNASGNWKVDALPASANSSGVVMPVGVDGNGMAHVIFGAPADGGGHWAMHHAVEQPDGSWSDESLPAVSANDANYAGALDANGRLQLVTQSTDAGTSPAPLLWWTEDGAGSWTSTTIAVPFPVSPQRLQLHLDAMGQAHILMSWQTPNGVAFWTTFVAAC